MLGGEALDEMKDKIGATQEFRAAVNANPKEPNAHFGLGYLLWTQYQYPEAALEFQAELDNAPDHMQAALYLADADIQMSRMDEARTLLEKLVKTSPDVSLAHLDLGVVYSEMGRTHEALTELQTAVRLAPAEVNAHWRLGRLYGSMGMTTEAKTEFENARTLNKASSEGLLDVMTRVTVKRETKAPVEAETQLGR